MCMAAHSNRDVPSSSTPDPCAPEASYIHASSRFVSDWAKLPGQSSWGGRMKMPHLQRRKWKCLILGEARPFLPSPFGHRQKYPNNLEKIIKKTLLSHTSTYQQPFFSATIVSVLISIRYMAWQQSPWAHWFYDAHGMAATFLGHSGLAAPMPINAAACTYASLCPLELHFHSHEQQGQEGLGLPKMYDRSLLSLKLWLPIQTDAGCWYAPALLPACARFSLGQLALPRNGQQHGMILIKVCTTP